MKRIILCFVWVFALTTISFAQLPHSMRVLNYVPDNCYSLEVVNLNDVAHDLELKDIHQDHLLDFVYKKQKMIKPFIQSWLKNDDKLGVDFDASVATCNSTIIIIPLRNEKNFEKMLAKISDSEVKFKTTTVAGRQMRQYADDVVTVLCGKEVAFVKINDTGLYADELYELPNPFQWEQVFNSNFLNSNEAKYFLEHDMSMYWHFNPEHKIMKSLFTLMIGDLSSVRNSLQKMNVKAFVSGNTTKSALTTVYEMFEGAEDMQPLFLDKMVAPMDEVEKLLPFAGEKPIALVASAMKGLGGDIGTYISSFASLDNPITLFMDNPFIYSLIDEVNGLFVTTVSGHEEVKNKLQQAVENRNRSVDSLYKERKRVYDESMEEEENNVEAWVLPYQAPDSISNHMFLLHEEFEGMDLFSMLTSHTSLFDEDASVYYDTTYVLVDNQYLFVFPEQSTIELIRHPKKPTNISVDQILAHPVYGVVDVNAISQLLGLNVDIPVSDMVLFLENNTVKISINASYGLQHGIMYEFVKMVNDFMKQRGR